MNDLKTLWFNPATPRGYHNQIIQSASGVVDEKIIGELINTYLPIQEKVIIDLGIGTGRELMWLDKLGSVKKIIGVDYSPVMLSFCAKEATKYKHGVDLIQDDLLNINNLPKLVTKEKSPVIYISLINTFGNFTKEERLIVLKSIVLLLKEKDRVILALYKRSQQAKFESFIQKTSYLKPDNPDDLPILAELIEYSLLPFFWTSVIEKYHQLPRFWYDKQNFNVVIHVDGQQVAVSHRFTKEEIEEEFKEAGLEVDQIIEGKAMYIAVGKKLI